MMAHDSSAPRPNLSAAAIAGLEAALSKFLANQSDGSLEPALRAITREARDKQIHAEQLLIVLKDVWFSLPKVRAAPTGDPQNALLQQVITQCIREYYSA